MDHSTSYPVPTLVVVLYQPDLLFPGQGYHLDIEGAVCGLESIGPTRDVRVVSAVLPSDSAPVDVRLTQNGCGPDDWQDRYQERHGLQRTLIDTQLWFDYR